MTTASIVDGRLPAGALGHRVAVVSGSTRGAGRGIAAGLGEAGATVLGTGRSSRKGSLMSDYQGRGELATRCRISELDGSQRNPRRHIHDAAENAATDPDGYR